MAKDKEYTIIEKPPRLLLTDDIPEWAQWDEEETEDESENEHTTNWLDEALERYGRTIRNPKEDRDERLTVTVCRNKCTSCGIATVRHHHAECEAPKIKIGREWKCGKCGTRIPSETTCVDCGATAECEPIEIPLDMSLSARSNEIEQAVHEETNLRRADNGIGSLNYSHHLSAIALQHSRDMAQRDFFDHTSPDDYDANDRYQKFDYDTRSSGENIAMISPDRTASPREAAQSVVDDWMNSKGHRENILRKRFTKEGIGVYLDSNGAMYVTQNFY